MPTITRRKVWHALLGAVFALAHAGCDNASAPAPKAAAPAAAAETVKGQGKDRYVVAVIPKSDANPVYAAARAGAEAARREVMSEHGIDVELRWVAPFQEDATRQAELINEMVAAGVDGLAVSCTDPVLAGAAIDAAARKGVSVVTFDSDAPDCSRFAYYGINDRAAGHLVLVELAERLEGKGRVGVLAGNRTAENLRNRVLGAAEAIRAYPEMEFAGVFPHDETPQAAAQAMRRAHEEHGPIDGWALLGGWPLYDPTGLDGVPEGVVIVSMDPLPPALDFAESGRVQALVAQPYFDWGYESVMMLFSRLHDGKTPQQTVRNATLEVIEQDDIGSYRTKWRGWIGDAPAVPVPPPADS